MWVHLHGVRGKHRVAYDYTYKHHTIAIDLWLNVPVARYFKECWHAEVVVTSLPAYTSSINVTRLFDTKDGAEDHARAFVEKWIDDGKPPLATNQL
jgi:hypothetical protein